MQILSNVTNKGRRALKMLAHVIVSVIMLENGGLVVFK